MKPFANEPELELRRESNRHVLTEALARLDDRLPLEVPILVNEDKFYDASNAAAELANAY